MSATPSASEQTPLAMICGGGSFPLAVADLVAATGRRVVLFPLRGAAEGTEVARYPHHWLYVGQIGRFMRLARREGCREVVFIGALVRPSFWQARPDLVAFSFLPKVLKAFLGGDNHLLSSMGKLLESSGFHLRGAHEIAPQILMPESVLGRVQPQERDRADIVLGLDYLKAAGPFDIGQAVVVAGRHVLAVEAAEGTDEMLARISDMRAKRRIHTKEKTGVLVKAPKPHQDRRFDLPSIGPQTVERVMQAKLAGIAVIAGETIVAETDKLIAAADRAGIFVIGVRPGNAP